MKINIIIYKKTQLVIDILNWYVVPKHSEMLSHLEKDMILVSEEEARRKGHTGFPYDWGKVANVPRYSGYDMSISFLCFTLKFHRYRKTWFGQNFETDHIPNDSLERVAA